jgi:hypothetical protein
MHALYAARYAIQEARAVVQDAIKEHGELFGLIDADDLLTDASSQISGEISKRLPERPIYEKHP